MVRFGVSSCSAGEDTEYAEIALYAECGNGLGRFGHVVSGAPAIYLDDVLAQFF